MMLLKNFLSKALTAVSTAALSSIFLGSALMTNSWGMLPNTEELSHTMPIFPIPKLAGEGQNLHQQKVAVKNKKTIGFVQEIFDTCGKIKNFNDNLAREFFENLGCTVEIFYPCTDWAGNKRGRTMISFVTEEGEQKLIYHQGFSNYIINHSLRVHIKRFLAQINRTPENLIVLETVD